MQELQKWERKEHWLTLPTMIYLCKSPSFVGLNFRVKYCTFSMHLGKWIQRRVFPDLRLIKKESFKFLEDEVVSILTNKIFFTIFESSVMTNCHHDLLLGSPSNHEEDDARMLFHAKDVHNSGIIKVSIPTEDTGIWNVFKIKSE